MCGKDKTHAKQQGNRLFKDKIEETKVAYSQAPSKQEKMVITKEIVTFMQTEYGSRFLKMVDGQWVEINNQAARDKVSHALRFAARNLNKSLLSSSSTNTVRRQNTTAAGSDDSVTSSTTSEPSVLGENDNDEDEDEEQEEEPVPLSRVFDQSFVNPFQLAFFTQQQQQQQPAASKGLDPSTTRAHEMDEEEHVALSFRSMELDDIADAVLRQAEAKPQQHHPQPAAQQPQPQPQPQQPRENGGGGE